MDMDYPQGEFWLDTDRYMEAVRRLQEEYRGRLEIGFGVELGLMEHLRARQEEYLKKYPFDFVIGSVHLIHGEDPYNGELFRKYGDEEVFRAYFRLSHRLLADAGAFALMRTVVLETIAANLGSMMTPIGNPQNLYLYMSRGLALGDFVQTLLPYALVSYILLALGTLLLPAQRRETAQESAPALARDRLVLYLVLLAVCLLSVLKVLPAWVAAVVVALAVALRQPDLLGKVDWALLATFLCFFIFVGNVKAAPVVSQTLEQLLTGRETLVAVVCSQVISNVPATLLLAPFTQNVTGLLLGVNLGGLGTLVASLASLISFKLYGRSQGAQRGRYLLLFTVANFGLLALLLLLVWVLG